MQLRISAQWDHPSLPVKFVQMYDLFNDSSENRLCATGWADLNQDNSSGDAPICLYSSGQWDTLGLFQGTGKPMATTRWGDTIIVAGLFQGVNGAPIENLAKYHNGSWSPFYAQPPQGVISSLHVIDEELYAIGGFDTLDGQYCAGIAKRNAGQWQPVGTFPSVVGYNIITDLVKWNGQLIIGGAITTSTFNEKGLFYLDTLTQSWTPIGPGVSGSWSQVRSLAVYQNDLYVSGSIPISANAGHGIMRWDGNQFHPVGTGFQGTDGTYQYLVGALSMLVHNNMLWCGGSFSYAGNVPTRGVAVWNGYQWCGVPDIPTPDAQLPVQDIAFYHDTLFAVTGESDFPINCVRRLNTVTLDSCSTPVGITELNNQPNNLRVHVTDDLNLLLFGNSTLNGPYSIYHVSGKLVYASSIPAGGDPVEIQLPDLAAGCYVLNTSASRSRFILP